jgi:hypothetical protein
MQLTTGVDCPSIKNPNLTIYKDPAPSTVEVRYNIIYNIQIQVALATRAVTFSFPFIHIQIQRDTHHTTIPPSWKLEVLFYFLFPSNMAFPLCILILGNLGTLFALHCNLYFLHIGTLQSTFGTILILYIISYLQLQHLHHVSCIRIRIPLRYPAQHRVNPKLISTCFNFQVEIEPVKKVWVQTKQEQQPHKSIRYRARIINCN